MSHFTLPLIVEPDELHANLEQPNLLLIDLCNDQQYLAGHIPGAIHVSPSELVSGAPPAPGKLPGIERIHQLFSRIGLNSSSHVVAYDDEGGGWAGRFLWTLEVIGHPHYSYLNGGLWAWRGENLTLSREIPTPISQPVDYTISTVPSMDKAEILANVGQSDFLVWDARGRDEFYGTRHSAQRNGHIPGAVHCEWIELMDQNADLRIRKDAEDYLAQKGLDASKRIVTHCHSHHRSGFTWLVGKSLGFNIKAYPGSWSEWGNDPETPIAGFENG